LHDEEQRAKLTEKSFFLFFVSDPFVCNNNKYPHFILTNSDDGNRGSPRRTGRKKNKKKLN
jgi:hypothetical protein